MPRVSAHQPGGYSGVCQVAIFRYLGGCLLGKADFHLTGRSARRCNRPGNGGDEAAVDLQGDYRYVVRGRREQKGRCPTELLVYATGASQGVSKSSTLYLPKLVKEVFSKFAPAYVLPRWRLTDESGTLPSANGAQRKASMRRRGAAGVLRGQVFLHTRGSVLLAMLLHGATNLFIVSPDVASTGDLTLPLLAAVAKWVLVVVVIVIAGPGLARGPRPEALPRTLSREASIHPTA